MKLSITDLKNLQTVAKRTNEVKSIFASKKNEYRNIAITIFYSPLSSLKDDVYPYFKLELREEEHQKDIFINGDNLKEVTTIFNAFTSQGIGESYLQNTLLPY